MEDGRTTGAVEAGEGVEVEEGRAAEEGVDVRDEVVVLRARGSEA